MLPGTSASSTVCTALPIGSMMAPTSVGMPSSAHDVRGRHRDELGEGAVPVDADDLGALAEVGRAQAALQAVAADDVAFGRDQVADGEQARGLGFAAELDDLAGELVADDDRGLEPVAGPAVPFPDVEVGAADARMVHADQRVAGAAGGDGHILQGHAGARSRFDEGAHRASE